MRTALLLVLCLLSLSASAFPNFDVALTSMTADKTTAQPGEVVRLTFRVKNNGPDNAPDVGVNLSNTHNARLYVVGSMATGGWQCSPIFAVCGTTMLAAGTEAELSLDVTMPRSASPSPVSISGHLSSGLLDNNLDNHRASVSIALQPSSRIADLSLSLDAPPNPIAENTPVTLAYDVHNIGPQTLNDIRAAIFVSGSAQPMTFAGSGWTCTLHSTFAATCRRDSLLAGEHAPLEVRIVTPSYPIEQLTRTAVFAAEPHLDPNGSNEEVERVISVGSAATWSRILLPITATDIPGANGSLWKTELTGFIEPPGDVFFEPAGCGPIEDPCSPPPVGRSFDLRDEDFIYDDFGSEFIYVSRAKASAFIAATRVYDASRSGETAGAFIPSARDDDFSEKGFTLIGIPVAEEFRSRLRIYDYDAKNEARVEVALYGDDEAEPFFAGAAVLFSEPGLFKVTTALLPSHPASAQIDLSALIPAGRYSRVRVAVRPLEPGLKVWGFVSITNNTTSHVTVVSP